MNSAPQPAARTAVVTPSPHLSTTNTTRGIMLDVIIALMPASVIAIYFFGWSVSGIMLVCVASCMATEYLGCTVLKCRSTVGDLSAIITGLLLALNLPAGFPLWQAALGGVIAIAAVKMLFGGLGQNIVNPALLARIVLMASFPDTMDSYIAPLANRGADAISGATPLAAMQSGDSVYQIRDLLFGMHGGCIGEVCALALMAGGVYLVIRRVITPLIPACFIGTVFVTTWLLGHDPVYHILSGGLMLGAIFMATDYTTSPLFSTGRVVYAVGCGLITVLIRVYGSLPEGISFAIIIMNLLVPLIDRVCRARHFGESRKRFSFVRGSAVSGKQE